MIHTHGKKQFNNGCGITGMESIPRALIASLNTLGLTNDEARVYATLVLLDHAEAKEIVEYLTLSKPSVYKALENLSERGLAIQQKSKPARYRAISPEIAVSILLKDHETAAEQALAELKKLEQEKVRTDREAPLWTIYGDANTGHKIRELFRKAKHHITFVVGDRYLRVLDNVDPGDVPMRLIILSSAPGLEEKLREKFPASIVDILIIPLEKLVSPPPGVAIPEIEEAWKFLKFENIMELNVDDEELLMNAAFFSEEASILDTRNKGAIIQMKMLSQLFWSRFIESNSKTAPHE